MTDNRRPFPQNNPETWGTSKESYQQQQRYRPPASVPRSPLQYSPATRQQSHAIATTPARSTIPQIESSNDDIEIEIDYQAVEQTIRSEETPRKKDLDTMLPKLAKRISTQQVKNDINHESNGGNGSQSADHNNNRQNPSSALEGEKTSSFSAPNSTSKPGESMKRRVSVTRSGSVSFLPSPDLPPEVEELRHRDIEPDENSAADQALKAAASLAAASSAGRRDSLLNRQSMSQATSPQEHQEVEGREIQQDHAQYALTYGMMLGIRVTTGRRDIDLDLLSSSKSLSAILEEQELTPADYDDATELIFKPEGNSTPPFPTPPHKLNFTFTFKDYMTNVFRAVRALSNIEEADYMLSLAGDFNYIEFIANSKSGQFFFYSHDGKYMIKTQSKEESKLLRKIMPLYISHLTRHPDSLLVRFYGMHRVKMKSLRSKTYFVIMSSVFNTPKPIAVKFDLKGSTVGRLTSAEDCRAGAVQKDLNLIESGHKIRLGEPNIDIFHETLKADVSFLKELNIMDYSLLLGIHTASNNPGSPNNRRSGSAAMRRRSSGVVLSSRSSLRVQSNPNPNQPNQPNPSSQIPDPSYPVHVYPNRDADDREEAQSHNNLNSNGSLSPPRGRGSSGGGRSSFLDMLEGIGGGGGGGGGASLFNSYYGGIRSTNEANEIYFMGIIDILQVYNTGKQMENFFKGFTHDRKQLSAVDPNLYADRMLNFIMQHTDYPDVMERRKIAQKAGKVNVHALHRTNSRQRVQQQQQQQQQQGSRK